MLKKLDLLTLIPNILLAFLIGLAGAGCLSTAFSLDVAPGNILLACGFWALAINVTLRLPKGGWIALGLMVLWGLHFWRQNYLQDMKVLLNVLFTCYQQAYGWMLPDFLTGVTGTDVTFAVATLTALFTMMAGISLGQRRSIGAILAAVLPLIPCLVVTDTVPATGWLLVTLVLVALLLITSNVRRVDARQASRLTAMLLIPLLLAVGALFALNPQDTYDKASDEETFGGRVLELLDKLPFVNVDDNGEISLDFGTLPTMGSLPSMGSMPSMGPFPTFSGSPSIDAFPTFTMDPGILDIFKDSVSLGNAGPRPPLNVDVMEIRTDLRGVLYLRERGYDIYTGTAWETTGQMQEIYVDPWYVFQKHAVDITTYWTHSSYFIPYYAPGYSLEGGVMLNPDEENSYTFQTSVLYDNWQILWRHSDGTTLEELPLDATHTQLPDATRAQAQAILQQLGITDQLSVVEAAEKIRSFVNSSATYDLNTQAMPEGTEDFALWFLTESDTGYCVHFATAATVLLRAAGIPARYVEGYMVNVTGEKTIVPAEQAHAWVEYFVPNLGWIVLEATPGSGDAPVPPETTPPTPPETTEPTSPETTLPTEPTPPETTLPTEPTPPETTLPSQTTEPSDPVGSTTPSTTVPESSATGTVPGTTQPHPDRTGLWITLSSVLFLLGSICALIGQWQLRLWLQQVWCRRGSSNQQALALWQVCRKLAKLRRQKAPAALRDLAWKAKYSQYTITDRELQEFHGYMERSIEHLKQRPWYLRIFYRVIFAAY